MKIVFMGTPEFSVAALESLLAAGHEVLAVYSQPPRPAGRGQKERKSPVHEAAEQHGLEVRTPKTLKSEEIQKAFAELKPDCTVVVAYGLLLPKAILDVCPCLNIHASLLPRWRGAAPIQRAIEAGDAQTGVTIMQMDEGMDTGPMLLKEAIDITPETTAATLHDELKVVGASLIVKALEQLEAKQLQPQKQPEGATHAAKLQKAEAHLDCSENVEVVERKIRAFNPFPGAYIEVEGEKIKILRATFDSGETGKPAGTIFNEHLAIVCTGGVLYPQVVQRSGKRAMPIHEFLRGFTVPVGKIVS
jgi:methionyl-tRNA formyltransferase